MMGSFHTFMNLLGAIGTLMQGTGLQNILELVYGENAVVHMMTGKSVQRAFRGHLLVDKCLNQAILSDLMNIDHDFKSLVGEAEIIYTSLIKREMAMENITLDEDIEYELNPFPPSVFEVKNLLRKADKPQLAHTLADHCRIVERESIKDTKPLTECYVLDGGSLLHRLSWTNGHSYGAIAQSYVDFTILHYGLSTVVFDGYEGGPSIKDNTHQRRGHNIHPVVSFTAETEFSGKKENFLSRN